MLFDSHSHLHFYQFDNDREEIVKKLRDFNVKTINVGTDLEESEKAVSLAEKHPDLLWASVGLHPNDISTTCRRSSASGRNGLEDSLQINQLKELAKSEKVVAIGECGLDYAFFARERSERMQKRASAEALSEGELSEEKIKEIQKKIFIKQIEISKELGKPLILHCRSSFGNQDAYNDAINILNSYFVIHNSNGNGVAHFFSGSKETAKKFLGLGFYISFAGPITFPPKADQPWAGASQYKELVEFVPLDRILIETDAPFAAPMPYRGRRNEPAYVEFVARKIAEWKNLSFDKVAKQTAINASQLFLVK